MGTTAKRFAWVVTVIAGIVAIIDFVLEWRILGYVIQAGAWAWRATLAILTSAIPVWVLIVGAIAITLVYSNRTRAARARATAQGREPDDHDADTSPTTPSQRERRKHWARLIAKVFEVDPLRCLCGATMRIVTVILEPPVIRKILNHLARPEARAHAPPTAG